MWMDYGLFLYVFRNVDDVLLCVLCQKANLKLVPHPLVNKVFMLWSMVFCKFCGRMKAIIELGVVKSVRRKCWPRGRNI